MNVILQVCHHTIHTILSWIILTLKCNKFVTIACQQEPTRAYLLQKSTPSSLHQLMHCFHVQSIEILKEKREERHFCILCIHIGSVSTNKANMHFTKWLRGPNAVSKIFLLLQVIKARFGSKTHLVFCTFAFFTNLIVMMSLTIAGTAVLNR